MYQRIGTCSQCGGDVMGYRGAWWGVMPPPPDECSGCGARRAGEVIDMVPMGRPRSRGTWSSTHISIQPNASGQCGCDHCQNKVGLR